MRKFQLALVLFLITLLTISFNYSSTEAQSGKKRPDAPEQINDPYKKKNQRPSPTPTPESIATPPETKDPQEVIKTTTNLVPIEATVVNKKTKQQVQGLTVKNFAIFVDGERKDITYFFFDSQAPVTVTTIVEFSKLGETLGFCGFNGCPPPYGQRQIPGKYEVLEPMRMFLTDFIKPPNDYVSVMGFDMRPTYITDFTNNSGRIQQAVSLMYQNNPAFQETNLWDALKLALTGGIGDSVVLENSKQEKSEYSGMTSVQGRHRAILLIASGIDTFSKINYGDTMKIVQSSGVPVFIIQTGQLFYYRYGELMDPGRGPNINGIPIDRLTFLQAQNAMKTFAKESGGLHIPLQNMQELPNYLGRINEALRNQYGLGYNPGDVRDGKQHKIVVKVDVDGDGQFDDKGYEISHRKFYNSPK